jgi:hypothetical protein
MREEIYPFLNGTGRGEEGQKEGYVKGRWDEMEGDRGGGYKEKERNAHSQYLSSE